MVEKLFFKITFKSYFLFKLEAAQWDIIWKSQGGIMVNARRPHGLLAAGPPEGLHSP